MSQLRTLSLTALLLIGMFSVPQESAASGSVGFFFGSYYPGYHHYYRPYFYRPYYYRPYYWGFYQPYGYGYGYPYSYYRHSYIGEVRTEVKPQEARVYVDGDYVGVADDFDGWWQRLELEPGRHRLVFRAPGFQPYVADVRVFPDRDAHIKYEMRPGQDQIAELEMRLPREEYSPRYRDRFDRREPYGRSHRYKDRDYDRYKDRDYDRDDDRDYDRDYDRKDDYEDRDWDRNRKSERDRDLDDKPYFDREQSEEGESNRRSMILTVEPSDATVYIDGNYYGTANDNGRGEIEVLLAEGVHRVEVVRPGYNSFSKDVTIQRQGENRLRITLQRK